MGHKDKQLLVFGYTLTVMLLVVGVRLWLTFRQPIIPGLLAVTAVIFLFLTIWGKEKLEKIFQGWMRLTSGIGRVLTVVLLTLVFYLLFTPMGFFLKLFGKDYLSRRMDRRVDSYWLKREPSGFDRKRYTQQF